jgi:hypothetical protein
MEITRPTSGERLRERNRSHPRSPVHHLAIILIGFDELTRTYQLRADTHSSVTGDVPIESCLKTSEALIGS